MEQVRDFDVFLLQSVLGGLRMRTTTLRLYSSTQYWQAQHWRKSRQLAVGVEVLCLLLLFLIRRGSVSRRHSHMPVF